GEGGGGGGGGGGWGGLGGGRGGGGGGRPGGPSPGPRPGPSPPASRGPRRSDRKPRSCHPPSGGGGPGSDRLGGRLAEPALGLGEMVGREEPDPPRREPAECAHRAAPPVLVAHDPDPPP